MTLKKAIEDATVTKVASITGITTYVPTAQIKIWDSTTTCDAATMILCHVDPIGEDSGSTFAELLAVKLTVSLWCHRDSTSAKSNFDNAADKLETWTLGKPAYTGITGWTVSGMTWEGSADLSDEKYLRSDYSLILHVFR